MKTPPARLGSVDARILDRRPPFRPLGTGPPASQDRPSEMPEGYYGAGVRRSTDVRRGGQKGVSDLVYLNVPVQVPSTEARTLAITAASLSMSFWRGPLTWTKQAPPSSREAEFGTTSSFVL